MNVAELAEYSTMLNDRVTLSNRRRLLIRPLRRCEFNAIREFYARLTPRTRYLRFFSPMRELPDSLLHRLACVDDQCRLSLVAEDDATSDGAIVGLGSFDALDEGSVELALVVRDDWQRQRIGSVLVDRLLKAAEERGFHRFVANVLVENVTIQRLLRRVGQVVSTKASGAVLEFTFIRPPSAA